MSDSEQTEKHTRAPAKAEGPDGGSGTAGPHTPEKDQAGSYARDAEQDPEAERHGRADSDGAGR